MPMWRCPHCGTPQAETARCWVCRRSSTTCSTCRHFRRSVAARLGYCGLDRKRLPISGLELRGCWEAGRARTTDPIGVVSISLEGSEPPSPALRLRDFVPVELTRPGAATIRDSATMHESATAGVGVGLSLGAGSSPPSAAREQLDAAALSRATLFIDPEL